MTNPALNLQTLKISAADLFALAILRLRFNECDFLFAFCDFDLMRFRHDYVLTYVLCWRKKLSCKTFHTTSHFIKWIVQRPKQFLGSHLCHLQFISSAGKIFVQTGHDNHACSFLSKYKNNNSSNSQCLWPSAAD